MRHPSDRASAQPPSEDEMRAEPRQRRPPRLPRQHCYLPAVVNSAAPVEVIPPPLTSNTARAARHTHVEFVITR